MKAPFRWLLPALFVACATDVVAQDGKRVIVLAFDGAAHGLTQKFIDEGHLPNLKALSEQGSFTRLETTNPSESAVSWSSFGRGLNPGNTNLHGFVSRKPGTYFPDLRFMKQVDELYALKYPEDFAKFAAEYADHVAANPGEARDYGVIADSFDELARSHPEYSAKATAFRGRYDAFRTAHPEGGDSGSPAGSWWLPFAGAAAGLGVGLLLAAVMKLPPAWR